MSVKNTITSTLRELAKRYPDHIKRAIFVEGGVEMTESKRRCPVQYGTLRASGTVHEPEGHGSMISVTLSYGGPGSGAEEYAVPVHEHPSGYDPPSWKNAEFGVQWSVPGTGPKYLESVLDESAPHMGSRIAARAHFDKMKVRTT